MKNLKKISLFLVITSLLIFVIAPVKNGSTKIKNYYSGDALSYQGQTVIATTNTGFLELFAVSDSGAIERFVNMRSFDHRFSTEIDFRDVILNIEEGNLYAYAVDGKSLVKYDVSDLYRAREVGRAQDNSWDWFGGVEKIHGYIASIGTNGIKLWTGDLKVFDQYKVTTPGNYVFNSSDAGSNRYVFTVGEKRIKFFDKESRSTIEEIPLSFEWAGSFYKRSIFNDLTDSSVFVVDDEALRKINFNGEIVDSFFHTSNLGYDVVPSLDGEHLYFSDGIGIVKVRKDNLAVVDYVYTQKFGDMGWSTGLKVVNSSHGEQIVVFNGTGIIILNSSLNPLKKSNGELSIIRTEVEETYPSIVEPVYLKIDRNRAASNSTVSLRGGGFGQNETLSINFLDSETFVLTDENGNFSTPLVVPFVSKPKNTDIKVTGQASNIKYSLGFNIE